MSQITTSTESEILESAKGIIKEQHDFINNIIAQAFSYAVVLGFDKRITVPEKANDSDYLPSLKHTEDTCILMHQGKRLEVLYSKKNQKELQLKPGDTVKCVETKHGIGIIQKSEPHSNGPIVTVKAVLDKNHAEIESAGNTRIILIGNNPSVEKGNRVILDETGSIIVKDLGKKENQHTFSASTGVSWDDIGGLDLVKQEIIEVVENPIKHSKLYSLYGKKPTKGILLYGPPGTGKTMIGKAVATSIAKVYNVQEPGFIYIKGPEILNMYVGASEERIRSIFASAKEFFERTGCPAIIFIDEAESILSKRGSGKSSDVDKTIVPQFLAEMDGLDESSAIVILTTNRPDMLDSAIIREGRIDKKIKVPRPERSSVESIFNLNLKKIPCTIQYDKIAKSAAQLVFDSSLCFYDIFLESGDILKFGLSHIINGAMIAAIVNDSITAAINRDLESKSETPTGVTLDDVHNSILRVYRQNSKMNHESHFEDLSYDLLTEKNDKIKNIVPVKIKEEVKQQAVA